MKSQIKSWLNKYPCRSVFTALLVLLGKDVNIDDLLVTKTNIQINPAGLFFCPWLSKYLVDVKRNELEKFLDGLVIKNT
jgi:hypothetical protein